MLLRQGRMWRGQVVGVTLGMLALGGSAAVAETFFVPDHYDTIQEAIVGVSDDDEIGVREGTYNEAIDFLGKPIRLYSIDGPDVTIIDASGLGVSVVKCVNGEGQDTVLDGFTITGGDADSGGGMYNDDAGPTVTNCTFTGNAARLGGGMANRSSEAVVTACRFVENTGRLRGGGMLCQEDSQVILTSCAFDRNTASEGGGGLMIVASTAVINECTFEENVAEAEPPIIPIGGGIYSQAATTTVVNCGFTANRAMVGAGMCNNGISTLGIVTNCTFDNNAAIDSAGGLDCINDADVVVTDCVFTGNSAPYGGALRTNWISTATPTVSACVFSNNEGFSGGGMMVFQANTTVTNCVFMDNEARLGAGLWLGTSNSVITNSTVFQNTATAQGGGLYSHTNSMPSLRNSIVWANTNGQIVDVDTSSTTVTYSDVEGGHAGMGNIDSDPLCDPATGRLLPGSQCIDAGDNEAVPEGVTTDVDGYPRFVNDPCVPDTGNPDGLNHPVDMGAYEYQPPCPADLNCNAEIEFGDLLPILAAWNCAGPCLEDLDDNGVVDFGDILVVLREWGQPCLCEVCGPVDDCDQAPLGGDGLYFFSNRHATTDGPALPPGCDEGNGLLFRNDVWMKYMALCDGTVTASVCDSDFDTRLAAYEYSEDECPGTFLACSDDACGEGETRSEVSFPVESGGTYLIRIGARFAVGEGTLVIDCAERAVDESW